MSAPPLWAFALVAAALAAAAFAHGFSPVAGPDAKPALMRAGLKTYWFGGHINNIFAPGHK